MLKTFCYCPHDPKQYILQLLPKTSYVINRLCGEEIIFDTFLDCRFNDYSYTITMYLSVLVESDDIDDVDDFDSPGNANGAAAKGAAPTFTDVDGTREKDIGETPGHFDWTSSIRFNSILIQISLPLLMRIIIKSFLFFSFFFILFKASQYNMFFQPSFDFRGNFPDFWLDGIFFLI